MSEFCNSAHRIGQRVQN